MNKRNETPSGGNRVVATNRPPPFPRNRHERRVWEKNGPPEESDLRALEKAIGVSRKDDPERFNALFWNLVS